MSNDEWPPTSGPEAIVYSLFRFYNSETRLPAMLDAIMDADRATFWAVFQATFACCDATWHDRARLGRLLRRRHDGCEHLTGADREFFGRLPQRVDLFRGCSSRRVVGLSWTTDRAVAESFARGHRGIPVRGPVIARIRVPRSSVLTVLTDRKESEVLIDWMEIAAGLLGKPKVEAFRVSGALADPVGSY